MLTDQLRCLVVVLVLGGNRFTFHRSPFTVRSLGFAEILYSVFCLLPSTPTSSFPASSGSCRRDRQSRPVWREAIDADSNSRPNARGSNPEPARVYRSAGP